MKHSKVYQKAVRLRSDGIADISQVFVRDSLVRVLCNAEAVPLRKPLAECVRVVRWRPIGFPEWFLISSGSFSLNSFISLNGFLSLHSDADYPDRWPDFLPQAVSYLSLDSGVPYHSMCGSLTALREAARGFEFRQLERAGDIELFFESVFKPLMLLADAALGGPPESVESAHVIKVITKILWSCR